MPDNQEKLNTKQQLRQKVRDFFQKEVLLELPTYEAERKQDKSTIVFIITLLFSFILTIFSPKFLFLAICIIPFLISSKKNTVVINADYEMKIKTQFMNKFLSIFGDYSWSKQTPEKYQELYPILRDLKIFPKTMLLLLDDTISGVHENVNIEISEIKTGFYANGIMSFIFLSILGIGFLIPIFTAVLFIIFSLGGTAALTGFLKFIAILLFFLLPCIVLRNIFINQSMKGVMIKLTMPKRFNKETFLYENKISSKKLIYKRENKYEKVLLEDVDFNNEYTVFSQDQVEARYLLTTSFMERFKNIKLAFQADYQRAEFKDNNLYIILGTKKDLFKMGSLNESTTYSHFNRIFEEIYSVISLVDHFKLNQKIGL